MTTTRQRRSRWLARASLLGIAMLVVSLASYLLAPGAGAQTSVATPTIDPMGGNHTDTVIVTIGTETAGAEIRFTLDESALENAWTVYTGPIELTPSPNAQVLRTKAYLGNESSALAQATFNVFDSSSTGQIELPDVTPPSGTYVNPVQVTVDGHTVPPFKIRQIHITIDGSEPRPYSNTGSGQSSPQNMTLASSTTVKALATQLGWANSDVVTRVYVLQCAMPSITAADAGSDEQTINMATETNNAAIRYTTDSSDPTESSSLYMAPFDVGIGIFELKARCFRNGFEPSPITVLEVNEPPTKFCEGLEVTVDLTASPPGVPTEGADVILGTDLGDVINALGGDDTICAGAGDDTIDGGTGADRIVSGEGHDVADGGAGDDTMLGGPGSDALRGGDGNDIIDGEADADVLRGGPGVDQVDGGEGDDRVLGGIGNDTLNGGPGNDFLGGFGGDDTIVGGPGNETIFGGFGADTILAGAGNDTVFGLIGDDVIDGGSGNDTLNGDRGNDTIDGGPGDDTIRGGNANDTLRGNAGDDSVSGGKADDDLSGGPDTDECIGNLETIADTADDTCETIFGVP